MSFSYYAPASPRRAFCAGATRGTLTMERADGLPLQEERIASMMAFSIAFAPGGAQLTRKGRDYTLVISSPGHGRVAVILGDAVVRQIEGHTPKIWHVSESRKCSGVLLVAAPGFQFESAGLNSRPWRRWQVQADGGLIEVPREAPVII